MLRINIYYVHIFLKIIQTYHIIKTYNTMETTNEYDKARIGCTLNCYGSYSCSKKSWGWTFYE